MGILEPGQFRLVADPPVALEFDPNAAVPLLGEGALVRPAEAAIAVHIQGLHGALRGDLQIRTVPPL